MYVQTVAYGQDAAREQAVAYGQGTAREHFTGNKDVQAVSYGHGVLQESIIQGIKMCNLLIMVMVLQKNII